MTETASPDERADRPGWLRPGTPGDALALAGTLAVPMTLAVLISARLVLVNSMGPLDRDAHPGGVVLSLVISVATGALVLLGGYGLARWSWIAFGVAAVVLVMLVVVLRPTHIDSHESFLERPGERSSCAGWQFQYYPPDTMDASSTVHCIGLESPLPPG